MRKHTILAAMLLAAATPALAQSDDDPYDDHYNQGYNQGETGEGCYGSGSYYSGCTDGQDDHDFWEQYNARQKEQERQRQEQFQQQLDELTRPSQSDCDLLPGYCPP